MSLPVVVISFNNHEFVANTIAQLAQRGVHDVIVIDNASTWDETQAYLDTLACRVIRNPDNRGHLCWTRPEVFDTLPEKFCVTDPDLQFNPNLPADFIDVMAAMAERCQAMKVGFALDLSDAAEMFPYEDYHLGQSIVQWERKFWTTRVTSEALEVYLAEVDTTFHVFNKRGLPDRQLRVAGAYTARHLPWYRTNPVIPPERMTLLYKQATRVSTIARFHMRAHDEALLAAVPPVAPPAPESVSQAVPEAPDVPVHLYQIAYSEASLAAVEPGYQVLDNLDNLRPDWYEYWPIRRFLLNSTLDENAFYGFFSPKFGEKTQMTHAQVSDFVRQAAPDHDVVLFSPQPDMAAFFLNVFEQGEAFDAGFMDATDGFLRSIGRNDPIRTMVMDSTSIVFSNYFVARPAFWREWFALTEQFFALCEGPDSVTKARCVVPTTYPKEAQRKVFIQERLASLVLATQPQWRVKAADPYGFGWSMTRFREHPHEAIVSDALKMAHLRTGFPEYMVAFAQIRKRFSAGAQAAA